MNLLIVSLRQSGLGFRFTQRVVKQAADGTFFCWYKGVKVYPVVVSVSQLPLAAAKRCSGQFQLTLFQPMWECAGREAISSVKVRKEIRLRSGQSVYRWCIPTKSRSFRVRGETIIADLVDGIFVQRPFPLFEKGDILVWKGVIEQESVEVRKVKWGSDARWYYLVRIISSKKIIRVREDSVRSFDRASCPFGHYTLTFGEQGSPYCATCETATHVMWG